MDDYIEEFSKETIDVTKRHNKEEYFTSKERTILLAQNEANTSLNYGQYADVLKKGYKKRYGFQKGIVALELHIKK